MFLSWVCDWKTPGLILCRSFAPKQALGKGKIQKLTPIRFAADSSDRRSIFRGVGQQRGRDSAQKGTGVIV